MKAYIFTEKDKFQDITPEIGKTYTLNVINTYPKPPEINTLGFSFIMSPFDIEEYTRHDVEIKDVKIIEIEILGDVFRCGKLTTIENIQNDPSNEDDILSTNKFKAIRFLDKDEYPFALDHNKNVILVKNKNGISWEQKFDEHNNRISFKMDDFEETSIFDEHNNEIHYSNSKGMERRFKYDSDNNRISTKHNDGTESDCVYDEKNNVVYCLESFPDGHRYESWYQYDQNNNMVYYKSEESPSDGPQGKVWEAFQKFDRNNNRIYYFCPQSNTLQEAYYHPNNKPVYIKHQTDDETYLEVYDYDSRGNQIYSHVFGQELTQKFDKNNNLIYSNRNHGKEICHYKYDENNNRIYGRKEFITSVIEYSITIE